MPMSGRWKFGNFDGKMDKNGSSNTKKAYATKPKTKRGPNPINPTSKLSENHATLRDGLPKQPRLTVWTDGGGNQEN